MLNPSYAPGKGSLIALQIILFRREQGKRQDLPPFSQAFDIPVDKLCVVHPTDAARRVDVALSHPPLRWLSGLFAIYSRKRGLLKNRQQYCY